MVKVHGKQSKRVTLRQRYNIDKKCRNANKKQRKMARKIKKAGMVQKTQKEPGIPNLFPYKEQMITQMENKERQKEEDKKLAKALRRKMRKTTTQEQLDKKEEKDDMEQYMQEVNSKIIRYQEDKKEEEDHGDDLAANDKKVNQSRKAYMKDLKSVVEQADVILEVLDARDPNGCRNIEMEHSVIAQNKKLVLVLNKIDLIPKENARDWLKVLRDEHPTILFKSSTQMQRSNLSAAVSLHKTSLTDKEDLVDDLLKGSNAVGTDNMIQLLKNYCRNDSSERKSKHSIIVGVIGFPNVGKSSLINSLKRSRVAGTGNVPGVTKGIQEVYLDKDIILLDSPGVVLSKENSDSLILRNVIKIDDLDDPITPVEALLNRVDNTELVKLYKIPKFSTVNEFLAAVARNTGKLSKGGVPDVNAAAKIVLRHWNTGKIKYYTPVSEEARIPKDEQDSMEED